MQSNNVTDLISLNNVIVTTNDCRIDVTQPVVNVIEVVAPGPKGDTGLSIPFESLGNGTWNTTSSIEITGSLAVSGTINGTINNAETASYSTVLGAILDNSINTPNEVFLLSSNGIPLNSVIVDQVPNAFTAGVAVSVGVTSLQIIDRPNLWLAFIDSTGPNGYITVDTPVTYDSSSKVLNVTSSYSQTSSFYQEIDPIFVAKSASLATTGSNIFIGDQIITGSLIVSSSTSVLDTTNAVLKDSLEIDSVQWENRILKSSNGVSTLNWDAGDIRDLNNSTSIDWQNRGLKNVSGDQTLYWNDGYLWDPVEGLDTLDWINRKVRATNGYYSLDWENRILTDKNGNTVLDWSESSLISINNLVSLTPQHPLPNTGISPGTFAVSASTPPKPYFWDGISWNALY